MRRIADTSTQYAEFSTIPEAFIVHDPVAVGAFKSMEGIDDPAQLLDSVLFRERPHALLYARQHRDFVELLKKHTKRIIYLSEVVGDHESFEAVRTNPNQVFTRDSLITIPWIPDGYIPARMAKPLRRTETQAMETAMKRLGLRAIIRLPENLFLEGGDVVPFSRHGKHTILVGYGQRTRMETLYYLQQTLIPRYADEIIGVQLAEWRINLDGGFLPVAEDVVVADLKSLIGGICLDERTQRELDLYEMLADLEIRIIEVTPDESVFCQACNCACLGERRLVYYDLSYRVYEALRDNGMEVYRTPGSELVKGRGGPAA
jgi:N-dimethylarginine dimethylaminohydrolase